MFGNLCGVTGLPMPCPCFACNQAFVLAREGRCPCQACWERRNPPKAGEERPEANPCPFGGW